jgi:hypothetical protein
MGSGLRSSSFMFRPLGSSIGLSLPSADTRLGVRHARNTRNDPRLESRTGTGAAGGPSAAKTHTEHITTQRGTPAKIRMS